MLYRWTQSNCKNVENPDLIEIIAKAMAKLQERAVLFKYVIEEYCVFRRSFLVGEFLNALTKGGKFIQNCLLKWVLNKMFVGPSGNPAPIEMRAHDAQIYVTDMLVWINKAIPVEKQNLHLLVKMCNPEGIK